MRALDVLSAIFAPGSGHFGAGRPRRGAFWIALLIASAMLMLWLGVLPMLVGYLAQIVDVAVIEEGERRGPVYHFSSAVGCWLVLLVAAVSLRSFWLENFRIPAGSMIPTLEVEDHVTASKWHFTPRRAEVIIFRYPQEPDKDFVKRVAAVGGDTIEIRDDTIVIDGKPVARTHVDGDCSYDDYDEERRAWRHRSCDAWDETMDGHTYRVIYERTHVPASMPPQTIPAGHVFVLGDNRDNSHDSRYWGTVAPELLRARPRLVWFSGGAGGVRWRRINHRIQ